MQSDKMGKVLRTVAVIFVGLTAAMNVLGGVGTTCAAFFTKKFPPMWKLLDYQWLYQAFVIVTVLVGLAGAWSLVKLLRGGKSVYRNALIVLIVGAVVNIIHVIASMQLRGTATPANVVMGLNLLTLVLMLVIGLPGMRERVDFTQGGGKADRITTAGLASIMAGGLILSMLMWASPSHTYQGENWVMTLLAPIVLSGGVLVAAGLGALVSTVVGLYRETEIQPGKQQT
jgi:hypothetical protein